MHVRGAEVGQALGVVTVELGGLAEALERGLGLARREQRHAERGVRLGVGWNERNPLFERGEGLVRSARISSSLPRSTCAGAVVLVEREGGFGLREQGLDLLVLGGHGVVGRDAGLCDRDAQEADRGAGSFGASFFAFWKCFFASAYRSAK